MAISLDHQVMVNGGVRAAATLANELSRSGATSGQHEIL
jgi:hypothetical protein